MAKLGANGIDEFNKFVAEHYPENKDTFFFYPDLEFNDIKNRNIPVRATE